MLHAIVDTFRLALRRDDAALRPHERESILTRDNGSEVRVVVMLTFPLVVALAWPSVVDGAHGSFLAAVLAVVVLNILGWTVPWRHLPRWVESVAPMLLSLIHI